VLGADVEVETARNDQKTAEAELARWGDRPLDGDYRNVKQRADWAAARVAAAAAN
jgi:hypothetical protein